MSNDNSDSDPIWTAMTRASETLSPKLSFPFIGLLLFLSYGHDEHPYGVGAILVIYLLLQWWCNGKNFVFVREYVKWLLLRFPIYVFAGFFWALFKLYLMGRNAKGDDPLRLCNEDTDCILKLIYSTHYHAILSWVTYWPLGMMKSFGVDVAREFISWTFYYFEDLMVYAIVSGTKAFKFANTP